MPETDPLESFDWTLTTWEGSRREQLRRWAELSLEDIVRAQEEMAELNLRFEEMRARGEFHVLVDGRRSDATSALQPARDSGADYASAALKKP